MSQDKNKPITTIDVKEDVRMLAREINVELSEEQIENIAENAIDDYHWTDFNNLIAEKIREAVPTDK